MYIVQDYTFSPNEAGQGTITIPATLKLEDFGMILNVSRGSVLYDPGEGSAGAATSYSGGSTILTLEQTTSYCLAGDKLQIVVLQGGGGEPATDVHVTNTALDPVPISGSVTVVNDPSNPVPVSVGNWPTSVEVSNDIGNPLPVTGLVTILGAGNNERYQWQLLGNPVVTGGSWVSAGDDSSVEYNLSGTEVSGGRILASGYTSASNQGSPSIDISKASLFSLQLERNGLTGTSYPIALSVTGSNASQIVFGSLDWEEVSR